MIFPLNFFLSWKIWILNLERKEKKKKHEQIIRQKKPINKWIITDRRKIAWIKILEASWKRKIHPSFIQNITRGWKSIRFSRTVELYKTNPPYAWRNSRYFITRVAFSVFNITAPLRARFLSLPRRNVSSVQEMHSCCNDIQKNFSPGLGCQTFRIKGSSTRGVGGRNVSASPWYRSKKETHNLFNPFVTLRVKLPLRSYSIRKFKFHFFRNLFLSSLSFFS